ncbi:MAG: X-Pro dipeptidyl-peptidase [Alcanivorax sp.]|nr:X-Pro dipeptidyl-peptidase [Alcanivorax sp.]
MRSKALALLACCLFLSATLSGCATTQLPLAEPGPVSGSREATRYQVKIPTHDGQMLAATVYQPALAAGDSAPLIIATHGYGGFRAKRPFSIYGKTMITGQAAIAAWRAGYWVVFYDQRGFGGSDDRVHMMARDKEVRDVSSVIDWSLAHLPGISTLPDGAPAIGMIGESYGAGAQILASFHEPRLQALVPIAGWHDLADAMAPNSHVRTSWGGALATVPPVTSGFSTQTLSRPWRSMFSGTLSHDVRRAMNARSPATWCGNGHEPQADVLLVQGFRDSLMTMDQALDNRECFLDAGRDARLLAIQGGHILPWPVQRWSGKPLFNTDRHVHCNGEAQRLEDVILSWWDEKLRGEEGDVPPLCIALDYQDSITPENFPESVQRFPVSREQVHIPIAGLFEGFMVPFDTGYDLFRGLWGNADRRFLKPSGGLGRPRFIPLYVVERDDELLLGTPEINLMLGGTASVRSTRVFVGVGVQHANQRRIRVASEQLTPLPKKGRYQQSLAPVATPLQAGDRVGLIVYGFNWQYAFNPSFWWSRARFNGEVALPLIRDDR